MSGRPEIKVFFKAADGSGYIDVCAFWRRDNGMLSGKLDASIEAIKVRLKDGTTKVLSVSEKGIVEGHYLNCRAESSVAPQAAKPGYTRVAPVTRAPRGAPADMPEDDFDPDGIPF